MSIHSSLNFDNIVMYDAQPEWMRSERYDYCEPFDVIVEKKSLFEKLIAFFK